MTFSQLGEKARKRSEFLSYGFSSTFRQIVSWLETECPVLEDCVHTVAAPGDLMHLLQHHKLLGHLEQHGQSHTKATLPLHEEKIVT